MLPHAHRMFNHVLPGLLLAATLAMAEGEGPIADDPVTGHATIWRRMLPRQIQAGPQVGLTGSRLRATSEYGMLIEPTPADGQRPTVSWGGILAFRWPRGISLTIAPRRETFALETREETVSFPGNPFPHTLKSSTSLAYNVWPAMLGMGWTFHRQHVNLQIGVYRAFFDHGSVGWTVDGEPYGNMPQYQIRSDYAGWMIASEYGFHLGQGDLLLGIEAQQGLRSMLQGMDGGIRAQSVGLRLAYVWTVMRR